MASACHQCGNVVDPVRAKARVFDGKIVAICRSCDGGESSQSTRAPAPARDSGRRSTCSECGKSVPAHRAKATIVGTSVRTRCDDCVAGRTEHVPAPHAEEDVPVAKAPAQARRLRRFGYAAAAIVVASVVTVVLIPLSQSTAPALRTAMAASVPPAQADRVGPAEAIILPPFSTEPPAEEADVDDSRPEAEILPEEEFADDIEVGDRDSDADEHTYTFTPGKLDPRLEIDGTWTHPLPGSLRIMPTKSTRRFGADRPGQRPGECRGGHCGIDLGAPRGTPVVAVADGLVLKAIRSTEDRGGRYVKIEHPSGMISYYMHLDRVLAGLRAGDEVRSGQMLGTLGATGIHSSAPHLHFMVKVSAKRGMRFVDPEPMFTDALVIDLLDMTVAPDDSLRATAPEPDDEREGDSAAETALHKSALGFVPGM